MQLIYAKGEPGRMSFGVTGMPTSLPPGAMVYAICDGTSAAERIDERTLDAMSELEYLMFKQMVNDAYRQEQRRVRRAAPAGAFRRFLQGLLGATAPGQRQNAGAY
jgi:hypothetical protein